MADIDRILMPPPPPRILMPDNSGCGSGDSRNNKNKRQKNDQNSFNFNSNCCSNTTPAISDANTNNEGSSETSNRDNSYTPIVTESDTAVMLGDDPSEECSTTQEQQSPQDHGGEQRQRQPPQPPPNTRFTDIIGHSAAKLRLDEALLPLALPQSLVSSVLKGIRAAPASILLFGPPGCGKTQLARAVAGEAQAAFISVGPSDILSKFVGESEAAVRHLFQEAREKALLMDSMCSVLFFDEIDALGQSRGSSSGSCDEVTSGDSNSSRRLLAELLIQMTQLTNDAMDRTSSGRHATSIHNDEGEESSTKLDEMCGSSSSPSSKTIITTPVPNTISPNPSTNNMETDQHPPHHRHQKHRIIVVAATNRPEDCDPALLRRFSVRVMVGLPTQRDRKKIIGRLLSDIDHQITNDQLKQIATATEGWSGSDLESITREAVLAPVRDCLRVAANFKAKSRRRRSQQKGGSDPSEEGEASATDYDQIATDTLLRDFQNLRAVTMRDFEEAVAFWMGEEQQQDHDQVSSHFIHQHNPSQHNKYRVQLLRSNNDKYDSNSSSDDE